MPFSWSARITKQYDDIHEWLDAVECEKIIVFEHPADDKVANTHIHALVINGKVEYESLKTRYRKMYGAIDRSQWRFKSDVNDDYNRFITYMSKGKFVPKLSKGFDPDSIVKLVSEWVDPKTTTVKLENGKLVRDVKETVTKTKREMLELMRSRMSSTDSTRDILRHIRKVLMDNNQVIGQYKMMDYYDSLMMYERESSWMYAMEQKINSKYNV